SWAALGGAPGGFMRRGVRRVVGAERPGADPGRAAGDGKAPTADVALGASLREALALLLQEDSGRIGVTDPDSGELVGVLTPEGVHRALRRAQLQEA
ncbi:ABC transporter ATP-binding protein, partial [Streptomyces vinaceus]